MNKQEAIKKLESIKVIGNDAIAACYNESINAGITLMKKIDEPQKPVVPKFVAEWIEYAKKKGDSLAISFKPWNLYGVEYSKTDRWIEDNQETFARAWIDGYEVEKEPLYSVIIAGEYLVKEISCSNEVKLVSTAYLPQYLAHHYQLTEKQIKAIDERYWPFAVPVEEVVE
ncbi:DUF1642 domain-containing protein [Enterococcus sp. C60(2024)]|uniref:DUF1642 domain-containing protein n=1 Tax=Enterococcus sp. C60(2024) TaxID=3231366 RepID=UPI00349FF48C